MRSEFLPFSPPLIGREEVSAVVAALESDWLTTGPRVKDFEEQFARRLDAPAALAVNSGTAALHLGLVALDIGPGDEVITSPLTFASCLHVIEHVGAKPVLADVEPDTLNLDPARVARLITPRTRAIMPIHLYGHPAELDALFDIAEQHGLAVIEDAAHALPATYRGRPIGKPSADVPNLIAFSFYATKNLTTGEGGMLTGPLELIERARPWALHGMTRDAHKRYTSDGSWRYDIALPGFKYNLTDFQAALGLIQLQKLEDHQKVRAELVARYQAGLRAIVGVRTPTRRDHVVSADHLYVIRLELERLTLDRSAFIEELRTRNVGSSVHFIPMWQHSYYRERYGWDGADCPIAAREFERLVSLPLHLKMSTGDVDDVVEAVAAICADNAA